MKKMLVYFNGGDSCLVKEPSTQTELAKIKAERKLAGDDGYMSGYRYFGEEKFTTYVFFPKKPADLENEIIRRRNNGLLGARWYFLKS